MRNLNIEWRHFAKDGSTCDRCSDTGRTLRIFVRQVRACGCARVRLRETILDSTRDSNAILFNGMRLEELLPSVLIGDSECGSCSELSGRKSSCRTVEDGGWSYEAVPLHLLHE